MTMHQPILAVDNGGRPVHWLRWQDAVRHYALDQVIWGAGSELITIHGGFNNGRQTKLQIQPVIAVRGADASHYEDHLPALTNRSLFARDSYICLYCGSRFGHKVLTRDHVIPRSRGGPDTWNNTVTACRACNMKKGARTPEQARMPLIALPYTPNYWEGLILSHRTILFDQRLFLEAQVPHERRID